MSKDELLSEFRKVSKGVEGAPDSLFQAIEFLTFAPGDEIVGALRDLLGEDWFSLPVWFRNLAYRLACLQDPQNYELLREAATDLISFGPDWDDVAAELIARADELEGGAV